MLVTDGNGLPIGLELASANHHEVKLAVPALQTVWVPRRGGGRPKQRPKELVAEKAYDSKRLRQWLRSEGIKPTIPLFERRARKHPKLGRPGKPDQATRSVGRWKGPSLGWETSGGSWCATSDAIRSSGPFYWSLLSSCL